tara:strand:- start:2364 stop:2675 length:312 start_codon:yes stop_codon:yes gene_type:complete
MFSGLFLQIIIKILVFIGIIYAIQYVIEYLKDRYTKPRVKDLVNTQIKKYKEILFEMNENQNTRRDEVISNDDIFNDKTNIDDMNNDLLTFMNSQTQQDVVSP